MGQTTVEQMYDLARTPPALEETREYLYERLKEFIRRSERVLVCFPTGSADSLGGMMETVLRRLEAVPMSWGPDHRWKALLHQAFASRATTVIGPPLAILGLSKLARSTHTPLYIRNVVVAGYPCDSWALEGIRDGLDCTVWGCYGPGTGPMVAGFSCSRSRGIHLRDAVYEAEVCGEAGERLPDSCLGEIVLSPRSEPGLRYHTAERGRLDRRVCSCGSTSPRILDFAPSALADRVMVELGENLLSWSSVLDIRAHRSSMGLDLEVVHFPGEVLPKLPTCARLVVRGWDPNRDMPFFLTGKGKTAYNFE